MIDVIGLVLAVVMIAYLVRRHPGGEGESMISVRKGDGNMAREKREIDKRTVQVMADLEAAVQSVAGFNQAKEMFKEMSKSLRKQLSAALGPEFQRSTGQITAQELMANEKLHEHIKRQELYLKKKQVDIIAIPAGLEADLAALRRLRDISGDTEDSLGWAVIEESVKGKAAAHLLNEGTVEGVVDVKTVVQLFLAARSETQAGKERLTTQASSSGDTEPIEAVVDKLSSQFSKNGKRP